MKTFKLLTFTRIFTISPLLAISCSQDDKIAAKETEINQLKKEISALNKGKEAITNKIDQASNIATNLWNSFSANKDVTSKQAYENAKRIFDVMLKQEKLDTSLVDTKGDKVL
ncbi:hypothetical protein [Mycoplasma phocimorsus]|uniref:hypothetical protein n=1 Tax=Mycoplasma phocimorsus TaxID=3045839 RepID=UPI0024C0BC5D|nr:hypothetical protein [Mycoplasma phocimorsus]MDJ1647615.1 hypothetical protein [Mycoplasma phocimorsus]